MVEEKLCQDVSLRVVEILVSREAEVYAVLHDEEALLALVALQTFEKLAVDLGKGPCGDLIRPALGVDIGIAELQADRDVPVAQLFEADLASLAVVLDQLAYDLELVVRSNIKVCLHPLLNCLW